MRPFNAVLREIERGRFHDECGERLAELTQKVREEGKGGTLTLTLKIEPASRMAGAVFVVPDVTIKPPKPPRDAAVFFDDDNGNLLREDPRNVPLPLMEAVPTDGVAPAAKEGIAQ